MARIVNVPTRIAVDDHALSARMSSIEKAVKDGIDQALSSSRRVLPSDDVSAARIGPVEVAWVGDGLANVPKPVRDEMELRISQAVKESARTGVVAPVTPRSVRAAASRRRWFVKIATSVDMKVEDFLDFMDAVNPELNTEPIKRALIDVLHERRRVAIWLVQVNRRYRLVDLNVEIDERVNALSPLGKGELRIFVSSPFDRDRAFLIDADRQYRVESRIPQLGHRNSSRVTGSRETARLDPGAWVVFSRMKVPEPPSLAIAKGQEAFFWNALRTNLLEGDRQQRSDAISTLVELRVYPRALEILKEGLELPSGYLTTRLTARLEILRALGDFRPRHLTSIWNLILHASQHDVDRTPLYRFREWFKLNQGRETIDYLERTLNGDDPLLQTLAAQVVLHLLAFVRSPEGAPCGAHARRLIALTERQDLWTGGPLGRESLRQLVTGQLEVVSSLANGLLGKMEFGPILDPHKEADVSSLQGFVVALASLKGELPTLELQALEAKHRRLSEIIQGLVHVGGQVESLHNAVSKLRDFLGAYDVESDELTVLFKLRHDYLQLVARSLDVKDFPRLLAEIDRAGAQFADTTAQVKWRRMRSEFNEALDVYHETLQIFAGGGPIKAMAFFQIRDQLRRDRQYLDRRFFPPPIQNKTTVFRIVDEEGRPVIEGAKDLSDAVDAETQVNLFRIRMAMFGHMSVALALHNQIEGLEIGSRSFRRRNGRKLGSIRDEIIRYYKNGKFQQFIDRDPAIQAELQGVHSNIRDEIRNAILIELLITAAAALLTAGTGLIARAALLGRTLSVIRTARAVETTVFLAEVGVFTASQLAGERIAFGREITLGRAAESTISNMAFFGGFRVLGKLTGPLLQKGGYGFVAAHTINLTTMTAVSALANKVQTGRWPDDIGMFLAQSLASYVIFVGVSQATTRTLGKVVLPRAEARLKKVGKRLDASNRQLLGRLQRAVESGTLTQKEFQNIKRGFRQNVADAKEIAEQAKNAGLREAEDVDRFVADLRELDTMLQSWKFRVPPGFEGTAGGQRAILALPSPEALAGVVREGESNIYHYNPTRQSDGLQRALQRYRAAGYRLDRRSGSLIEVIRPDGRTAFVLDPTPATAPIPVVEPLLLPAAKDARPLTAVERALGRGRLPSTELDKLDGRLRRVNRTLVQRLETEFLEQTFLATVRLLAAEYPQPMTGWRLDAVRGLATMLDLRRGIPLSAIHRLFLNRSSAELNALFLKYHRIKDMAGSHYLVADGIRPSRSVQLIETYDALRRGRIRLPADMSREAVQGLLRWIREGRDVPKELLRIRDVSDRRVRLEADNPIRNPHFPPPSAVEKLLREHATDIRPGLNLLNGTPSEVARAVEAYGQRHKGRFADQPARTEFEKIVDRYRNDLSRLQSSVDPRNVIGGREEINTILVGLELGAEIFTVGNINRLTINPGLYGLPRGNRVVNGPREIIIQLDLGARRADGRLLLVEATTGHLTLPKAWKALDPQSGSRHGQLDWLALNKASATHRKWHQIIKLWQARKFGHDLGKSWSGVGVEMPALVMRAGSFSKPALRALKELGFETITTGGGGSSP